jgi:hypothetical protein
VGWTVEDKSVCTLFAVKANKHSAGSKLGS